MKDTTKLKEEINKLPNEFTNLEISPKVDKRKSLSEKDRVIKDVMNNIFYLDLENQVVRFYSEGVDNDTVALVLNLLDGENLYMLTKRLLIDRTITVETRKYVFDWNIEFLKENKEKIIEEVKKIIHQIVRDIIDASFVKPNFYKRIVVFFKNLFQKPPTQENKKYNFELVYNTKETIVGDFNDLCGNFYDVFGNMLFIGKDATLRSPADIKDEDNKDK